MHDFNALYSILQGFVPVHSHLLDSRGWGKSGIYIVKEGYRVISNNESISREYNKWIKFWCNDGLPKINAFIWILDHWKIMTAENLKKRGIQGPLRYVLCKEAEETIDHLFLHCNFSTEVWTLAVQELQINLILPTNWNDLFACWKDYYHGYLLQKPDLTRAWVALPKYLCWKIWVTRNKNLFEDEASCPMKERLSAKSLWVEALVTDSQGNEENQQ